MILHGELRWSDFQMLRKYETIICDLDGTLYDDKVFMNAVKMEGSYTYQDYLNKCRTVDVKLELFPEAKKLLAEFNGRIAILTNGDELRQQHKMKLLGLNYPVYYADGENRKPSPKGVEAILRWMPKGNAIMIGNDITDLQAAENANIDFIWWEQ